MRIRSAGEIMNYFDFYSMQADSLHARVPISILNSFLTKMLGKLDMSPSTCSGYIETFEQFYMAPFLAGFRRKPSY